MHVLWPGSVFCCGGKCTPVTETQDKNCFDLEKEEKKAHPLMRIYVNVVTHRVGRFVIVVLFLALAVFSILSMMKLEVST